MRRGAGGWRLCRGLAITAVAAAVAGVMGAWPFINVIRKGGCEVRDGGEIAFSGTAGRLRGLDMIM